MNITTRKCNSCGQEIEATKKVCPFCGKAQEDKKGSKLAIIILIVLSLLLLTPIIIGIIGLIWFRAEM